LEAANFACNALTSSSADACANAGAATISIIFTLVFALGLLVFMAYLGFKK
jgi:hypothetical protein